MFFIFWIFLSQLFILNTSFSLFCFFDTIFDFLQNSTVHPFISDIVQTKLFCILLNSFCLKWILIINDTNKHYDYTNHFKQTILNIGQQISFESISTKKRILFSRDDLFWFFFIINWIPQSVPFAFYNNLISLCIIPRLQSLYSTYFHLSIHFLL